MNERFSVSPIVFASIQTVDIDTLSSVSSDELRPILPCLVRMSLCGPLDISDAWTKSRKKILKCLSGIEVVNNLVGLLSVDFHLLQLDTRKEIQLRAKLGSKQSESVLTSQLEQSLTLEFEKTDPAHKMRLLLSELLFVISQVREQRSDVYFKSCELLENDVYLDEVSDVLCIAQAELSDTLPLLTVCEGLMHMKNGTILLCRLIANQPDRLEQVLDWLVSSGEKQDEDSVGGERRREAIHALCEMSPDCIRYVINLCVQKHRMPSLATHLTLQLQQNERKHNSGNSETLLAFLTAVMLGDDAQLSSWFAQYCKLSQKQNDGESTLSLLRKELLIQLQNLLKRGEATNQIEDDDIPESCEFIKVYCALKALTQIRFSEEECLALVRLITRAPPKSLQGEHLLTMSLCMLLACPYLLGPTDRERSIVDWLRWLVANAPAFTEATGSKAAFGEMLLLIAIHFHGNQNHAIAELVNSTLHIKHAVKTNSLARLKALFTQEVFTEQVVAEHAVKVPVTVNLNAKMNGHLPVHCIHQLLKSRVFSRHKVQIKDWIFLQITACTTPIHPVIPQLIQAYIQSVLPVSGRNEALNPPMAEQEIVDVFRHSVLHIGSSSRRKSSYQYVVDLSAVASKDARTSSDSNVQHFGGNSRRKSSYQDVVDLSAAASEDAQNSFTTQLLLLYYLLLYKDTMHTNMKNIVASQVKVHMYSEQLWAQLPLKYLLHQAHKQQHEYAGLFSPLIRMLATHYPHLCLVHDWLDEDHTLPSSSMPPVPPVAKCSLQTLTTSFSRADGQCVELLQLEALSTLSGAHLLPYAHALITHLPQVLGKQVPKQVQVLLKGLWCKLNTVIPRRLRVMTVNALREKDQGMLQQTALTEEDLTTDPLLVLNCDRRVLRCVPVLEILLRVLEAYLQASKIFLANQTQSAENGESGTEREQLRDALIAAQESSTVQPKLSTENGESGTEREQLRDALIAAQESSAVQVLLDTCLPQKDEAQLSGGSQLNELREVQGVICTFLHQKFIADPALVKLVHFQGYPAELLKVTVPGIPSMHICLDFIPELIAQPHLDKQIFAVELVSHLSVQYAVPRALNVAKLAVSVTNTLLTVLGCEDQTEFFSQTLPALARITRAFPPLCDDVVNIFVQLGKICTTQLAKAGIQLHSHDYEADVTKAHAIESETSLTARYLTLAKTVHRTFTELSSNTTIIRESQ